MTAAYIVLIILVGPALTQEFGLPILIAHLVVFWYSQDSNVTPPVALAGFAGAAIAGSKTDGGPACRRGNTPRASTSFRSSWCSTTRSILGGPLPVVIWNGAIAIVALTGFAVALEGFLWRPMPLWQRLLIVPGVIAVFWPDGRRRGGGWRR